MRATALTEPGPVDWSAAATAATPAGWSTTTEDPHTNWTEHRGPVMPKIRWHDLRHLAASALISEGASIAYLSRLLGHANPAITLSIYTHQFAAAEHAERTRGRMEEAFGQLL